jgi:hypothetical protein
MSEAEATGAATTGEEISTAADTTQAPVATQATAEPTEDQRTFTQEDVDRFVVARLKKAERQWEERLETAFDERLNAWRENNGITDEALSTLDQRPEHEKELSMARGTITRLEKESASSREKAERMRSHLLETSGRDAIVREALAQGSVDPESVFLHVAAAKRLAVDEETFRPIILDENGDIDAATQISDLVKQTLDARPNLAKPRGVPGSGSRPTVEQPRSPDVQQKLGTPGGLAAAIRSRFSELEQ